MTKYKYVILIIAVIAIIAGLFFIATYNMKKASNINNTTNILAKQNNILNDNRINNEEVVSSNAIDERKISPDAIIVFNKFYKKCKHTTTVKEPVTQDMVNLTEPEFTKLYSDWKVQEFSNNKIELYKEYDEECGEHYIVKDTNGVIGIYKKEESGELTLLEKTEISTQYLSESDKNNLENGISLIGKEELNAYIENFE